VQGLRASSLSDVGAFRRACIEAATQDTAFDHFRQNEVIRAVFDHVTEAQGEACLQLCPMRPIEALRLNDSLGAPTRFDYPGLGLVSPTTLRYLKIATDLNNLFGSLDGMEIVEIGAGFGGQARLLHTLNPAITKYTIIDLPEVLTLAKRYLTALGVDNVEYLPVDAFTARKVPLASDLFISNYAVTECAPKLLDYYMRAVAVWAPRGYLIGNAQEPTVLRALTASGAKRADEKPSTGEGNYLCTWGVGDVARPGERFHPYTIPLHLVDRLRKKHDLGVFIETGTAAGHTAEAVRGVFDFVYTIELDRDLYEHANRRFFEADNVMTLRGDSKTELPGVISAIRRGERALYWLDAHWSGGETATRSDEVHTAVCDELESIRASGRTTDVIMIDDIADFKGEHGYPTVEELIGLVLSINPTYSVAVHMELRRGVLVAEPG
jgi:protein-L-isoaspartate O-methyltransferase